MLLVTATAAVCAQDVPVQTDIPVINCNVDVFSATMELSHDDPQAVIYWRYNYYDWTDWTAWTDWKVYTEPVELQFKDNLYIIDYQVECYAVSPGKDANLASPKSLRHLFMLTVWITSKVWLSVLSMVYLAIVISIPCMVIILFYCM